MADKPFLLEHAVDHDLMQMGVQIETVAEPMLEYELSTLRVRNARLRVFAGRFEERLEILETPHGGPQLPTIGTSTVLA